MHFFTAVLLPDLFDDFFKKIQDLYLFSSVGEEVVTHYAGCLKKVNGMLMGWQERVSCCLYQVEPSGNIECAYSWLVGVVQPAGDSASAKVRRGSFGSDFPLQKVLGI